MADDKESASGDDLMCSESDFSDGDHDSDWVAPSSESDSDDDETQSIEFPLLQLEAHTAQCCTATTTTIRSAADLNSSNDAPVIQGCTTATTTITTATITSAADPNSSNDAPVIQGCTTAAAAATTTTTTTTTTTNAVDSSSTSGIFSGLSANFQGKTTTIKPHFCIFCGVSQKRLVRHLLAKHKDEKNMVPYLNATSKTDKKAELQKLRYAGDYKHNKQVLNEKKGEIVVRRRKQSSTVSINLKNFSHCPTCFGLFQAKDLYRHMCTGQQSGSRRDLLKKGRLLIPDSPDETHDLDDKLKPIFSAMQADSISLAAKNDPLIKCLGRKEAKKNGFDRDRHGQVRNRLREMGRLLLKLREVSYRENAQLKDFLTPAGFKLVVESTMKLAGFDEGSSDFKTPTLAVKIGHTVKLCADILEAQGIEQGDEVLEATAKGYLKLHNLSWHEEVSAHAYRSQYRKKKGKAKRIPLSRDVAVLAKYLSDRADGALKRLSDADDKDVKETWIELSELTLTQIILFNRRRQGEASKMKVEDFTGQQHSRDPDVINSLSDFEKKLCEMLTRVEIYGKRGRIVPVLLSTSMKQAVEDLIKFRGQAGVSESNRFIFACSRYQSEGHIRGSDTLRKFVRSANLQNPEDITSTGLRKQVATLSQVLNLKDNELDLLAQYMGHDVRIHRENYRLPSDIMQLAKVSKLLQALEKGSLLKNKGRSLDEVDVDEDEECSTDDEQGSEEEDNIPLSKVAKQRLPASGSEEEDNIPLSQVARQRVPASGSEEEDNIPLSQVARQRVPASESDEEISSSAVPLAISRRKTTFAARTAWSDEEVGAVLKHLDKYILLGQLPGKDAIEECLKEKALRNRTWRNVKDFVRNRIKKNKCKD